MVETKLFAAASSSSQESDDSPPLVPVQALDDVWQLQAVPVVEPSAPSYLLDDGNENHDDGEYISEPIPTIDIASSSNNSGDISDMDAEQDPESKLAMGAGVASGVLGL